jgi:hypothetical protein
VKRANGFDTLQQALASGRFPLGTKRPWRAVIATSVIGGIALTALALPIAIWMGKTL